MKYLLILLLLATQIGCSQTPESARDVDAFKQEITKPNVVVLDVRTPDEYNQGHLQNAINIDYRSPEFTSRIDSLSRDKQYELYCHSGKRSGESVKIMKEKGFKNVHDLNGGISVWEEKGNPVVK